MEMKISTFNDKISDDFCIELLNFRIIIGTQNMMIELIWNRGSKKYAFKHHQVVFKLLEMIC